MMTNLNFEAIRHASTTTRTLYVFVRVVSCSVAGVDPTLEITKHLQQC